MSQRRELPAGLSRLRDLEKAIAGSPDVPQATGGLMHAGKGQVFAKGTGREVVECEFGLPMRIVIK